MSRSKRKPIWTEGYGGKRRPSAKHQANKAVRNTEDIGNGKAYRKEYNPWNITDYKLYDPKSKKVGRK